MTGNGKSCGVKGIDIDQTYTALNTFPGPAQVF
jgi:hypothetical protein